MLIEIYSQQVVLCEVGIADVADEEGNFLAQFYPIELLLKLRTVDKLLEGHPYLDLEPAEADDRATIMAEILRPRQVKKLVKGLGRGDLVGLKIKTARPPKRGQSWLWERAQAWQAGPKARRQRVGFLLIRPKDYAIYLSEADIHWLAALRTDGALYYERLLAIQAIGEFALGLGQMAARAKKKQKKQRKKQR